MIYNFSVTTPANTARIDRIATEVKLTSGIIHEIDLVFPPGCAGLLYVAVNRGLNQIWPTNPGEFFATDGEVIDFKEFFQLNPGFDTLTIHTYNLDETYAHTVIVRFGILKESEIRGVWFPWTEEELE